MDAFAVAPTVLGLRAETSGTGDYNEARFFLLRKDSINLLLQVLWLPIFSLDTLMAHFIYNHHPQESFNVNGVQFHLPQAPKTQTWTQTIIIII